MDWECAEATFEPLRLIGECDPVTCAIYVDQNGLLNKDGWKQFKRLAKSQKKLLRMANQAKLISYHGQPKYKFGIRVPRNHTEAVEIDLGNKNNKWKQVEQVELDQIDEYEVLGHLGINDEAPPGYKLIKVHFVYDVKHDGRHKARLVAGEHLTETPTYSVSSSVATLRGLRLILFVAELNNLKVWTTDVGNAYLEAYTQEKVYIVDEPEFRDRGGHVMLIKRALYGLRSLGLM